MEVTMLKELRLGLRTVYAVLGALTLAGTADFTPNSMVVLTIFLLMGFSFLHEFVFLRHMINTVQKVQNKFLGLLAVMLIATGVALYALYTLGHFNWVGEESEVVLRYALWYGVYVASLSMFISGAVVRRSMQHHKVI